MPRATRVIAAAHAHERKIGHDRKIADTLILDYAQRSTRKFATIGVKGLSVEIDLHEPRRLRTDDLLELDDGRLVDVVAAPEPIVEARVADAAGLVRLAWQLGDRHVPVQVLPNRIRVQGTEAAEALLKSFGVKTVRIEAPFEPEGGAYEAHAHHDHAHEHGHAHDHDRAHDHDSDHHLAHGHGHKHHGH